MTPDTNMVERVARAICARERGDGAGECKTCREAHYEYDPETQDHVPVDLPAGCLGRGYAYLARAAIAAMREPTEAMLERGPGEPYMDRAVWAGMIDAALAEGEKG